MVATIAKMGVIAVWTVIIAVLSTLSIVVDRSGNTYHRLSRLYMRGVLKVSGVNVRVDGLERLDFSRGYVYVANHASYFDIPAVLGTIPDQIRIVYKRELEKIPFLGWALKLGKTYIAIDRSKGQDAIQGLDDAARKIREGASVLLFAEGTRTSDGKLQPFKRGAFSLAVRAGVPVVPVTINGSYRVFPRGSLRIRPGTIRLVLDRPIEPAAANGKETELALRNEVRRSIEQHYEEG